MRIVRVVGDAQDHLFCCTCPATREVGEGGEHLTIFSIDEHGAMEIAKGWG